MRYINKQKESARIRQKESSRVIGAVKNVSFEELKEMFDRALPNWETRSYGNDNKHYYSGKTEISLYTEDMFIVDDATDAVLHFDYKLVSEVSLKKNARGYILFPYSGKNGFQVEFPFGE